MNDVVVSVKVDDKPQVMDKLEILLISTKGKKEAKTYTDLSSVAAEWEEDTEIYKMVSALFNQDNARPAPPKLIRKVTVVGMENVDSPEDIINGIKEYAKKNNDWYIFMTDRTESDYILKLSEFAQQSEPGEAALETGEEDHRKLYFARTCDKQITGVKGRSVVIYTDKKDECIEAAYLGAVGPWYPKHVTWKFKMPEKISVPELNTEEINTLEKNHVNFVSDEYKNNYIKNGVCADGEWIDSLLGADWIAQAMRNELYQVFMENEIVPYTDPGFALVAMAVFRALDKAVEYGIIATNSDSGSGIYEVIIPSMNDATEEEARSRIIPDIIWEAQLEGAVQGVKTKGVLRVKL